MSEKCFQGFQSKPELSLIDDVTFNVQKCNKKADKDNY